MKMSYPKELFALVEMLYLQVHPGSPHWSVIKNAYWRAEAEKTRIEAGEWEKEPAVMGCHECGWNCVLLLQEGDEEEEKVQAHLSEITQCPFKWESVKARWYRK